MKQLFFILFLSLTASAWAQKGTFLSAEQFREHAFSGQELKWETLWLTQALRDEAEMILGHSFKGLRLRYWGQDKRTAWIFEEIGKERPITIGVVVEDSYVDDLVILAFRESRGGEVRYPFFTEQFTRLGLSHGDEGYALDGNIDGITGATLSVRAVKNAVTLALFFHQQTPFGKGVLPQ